MEKVEYHLYEVSRNGFDEKNLSFADDENWFLIDLSNTGKIKIQSGKRIDNLLRQKKIDYDYLGLESYDRKEIPIISS